VQCIISAAALFLLSYLFQQCAFVTGVLSFYTSIQWRLLSYKVQGDWDWVRHLCAI